MGCGVSKSDIAKEGETSCLCTRLSLVHRPNERAIVNSYLLSKPALPGIREEDVKGDGIPTKVNTIEEKEIKRRENFEKEEACIDKESSEEDLNDRNDGISLMQSPSFRVYCIPSQFDDENSEGGDNNPEEIKDNPKVDVQNDNKFKKGSSIRRHNEKVDVQNDSKGPSIRRVKTSASGKEKKSIRSRFFRYMTFQSS